MTVSTLSLPSTFAPSLRPIYLYPTAPMSKKLSATSRPLIARAISQLLARAPGRVLIHTVSYDLNDYLYKELRDARPSFTYAKSSDKDLAIRRYRDQDSSVLYAPSLERGVDLPDDFCRHIVVAKIPFPNLGDKQISSRLYSRGGQSWYAMKTIRSLVQMTGRGMRSENDWCNSYILDSQFLTHIWNRTRHLLPAWWKEALVWDAGSLN